MSEHIVGVHVELTSAAFWDDWDEVAASKELEELILATGSECIALLVFKRDAPVPKTFLGKGQLESLKEQLDALDSDAVVFDQDLSSVQQRSIEEALDVKVIDRTQLILDIFAQRAHTKEGKVQVELAQLKYMLPRLTGQGRALSRLGGGIGTRGPGEQKLEVDRRHIRTRIGKLQKELQQIEKRRDIARKQRRNKDVPSITLMGYTNAGKSTLLQALAQTEAVARNQLFTTLDPLSRQWILPNRQQALLTDTVGFLHHLPHHLVEAFKSTLEVVVQADILLHVLDASDPLLDAKVEASLEVVESLHVPDLPILTIFNKSDLITATQKQVLQKEYPESLFISAETGQGLDVLADRVVTQLSQWLVEVELFLPISGSAWLDKLYSQGQVLEQEIRENQLFVRARIPHPLLGQLQKAGLLSL